MSYARFNPGHSDIYLWGGEDYWVCGMCKLKPDGSNTDLTSIEQVVDHLVEHANALHKVPDYAIWRARAELQEKQARTRVN